MACHAWLRPNGASDSCNLAIEPAEQQISSGRQGSSLHCDCPAARRHRSPSGTDGRNCIRVADFLHAHGESAARTRHICHNFGTQGSHVHIRRTERQFLKGDVHLAQHTPMLPRSTAMVHFLPPWPASNLAADGDAPATEASGLCTSCGSCLCQLLLLLSGTAAAASAGCCRCCCCRCCSSRLLSTAVHCTAAQKHEECSM